MNQTQHAADLISAPNPPYHRHMNQPSHQEHPTGPVTTDGQPAQHPWPPYPGYPPPQQHVPRRFSAPIVAAILFAGGRNDSRPPAMSSSPSSHDSTAAAPAVKDTQTCRAWRSTGVALEAIPTLPDGWDWNTDGIDTLIANERTAVEKALDIFKAKIKAGDPETVVDAANKYISAKHAEMDKLSAHTYTTADGVPVSTGYSTLDELCGVK
jgi:hypothetical protein